MKAVGWDKSVQFNGRPTLTILKWTFLLIKTRAAIFLFFLFLQKPLLLYFCHVKWPIKVKVALNDVEAIHHNPNISSQARLRQHYDVESFVFPSWETFYLFFLFEILKREKKSCTIKQIAIVLIDKSCVSSFYCYIR